MTLEEWASLLHFVTGVCVGALLCRIVDWLAERLDKREQMDDTLKATLTVNGDLQRSVETLRAAMEWIEDGALAGDRIEIVIGTDDE